MNPPAAAACERFIRKQICAPEEQTSEIWNMHDVRCEMQENAAVNIFDKQGEMIGGGDSIDRNQHSQLTMWQVRVNE